MLRVATGLQHPPPRGSLSGERLQPLLAERRLIFSPSQNEPLASGTSTTRPSPPLPRTESLSLRAAVLRPECCPLLSPLPGGFSLSTTSLWSWHTGPCQGSSPRAGGGGRAQDKVVCAQSRSRKSSSRQHTYGRFCHCVSCRAPDPLATSGTERWAASSGTGGRGRGKAQDREAQGGNRPRGPPTRVTKMRRGLQTKSNEPWLKGLEGA